MLSPMAKDDESTAVPFDRVENTGSQSQSQSHSQSQSQTESHSHSQPQSQSHSHSRSHARSHSQSQAFSHFGSAVTPAASSTWGLGEPTPSHHLSSEASTSPAESWRLDEFVTDPGYLAYQEELRCLIFNTAQTAAPTREGTPEAADGGFSAGGFAAPGTILGDEGAARRQAGQILGTGRRLEYLKNYVGEVATWVSLHHI